MSVKRWDTAGTMFDIVLRGELFKAGESNPNKLRWCEISADGMLTWADKEDQLPKDKSSLSLRGALITPEPDRKPITAGEARYGLRISPSTPGARGLSLQAASDVERQFWVEAMNQVAHAPVGAFRSQAAGRTVEITRPIDGRLGIDLGQPIGTPCVTVVNVGTPCGLLVGDVIVAVNNTVLRTHEIAARVLSNAPPGKPLTLRLASYNREVRIVKQAGVIGLRLCAPVIGPGVMIRSVARDSAAAAAGLHIGDRILAINSQHCEPGQHEQATERLIDARVQEVRLVLAGVTVAIALRKDTDGFLGVAFQPGPPGRNLQGSTFSDIVPGSASHKAGVRHGDVLLAVDNDLVERGRDQATELLKGTARAITLVVWRPRPDPSDDEAHQTSARDSAAAKLAKEARAGVGAVDVEYFTHNLLGKLGVVDSPRAAGAQTLSGMGYAVAPLPHKVPPFEDLTGC